MKIMATLTGAPGADPAAFAPLRFAEQQQVWADYCAGRLREIYWQASPATVTVIFEAESRETAGAWLATYPMVKAGLLTIELRELAPWHLLEELFGPDARA